MPGLVPVRCATPCAHRRHGHRPQRHELELLRAVRAPVPDVDVRLVIARAPARTGPPGSPAHSKRHLGGRGRGTGAGAEPRTPGPRWHCCTRGCGTWYVVPPQPACTAADDTLARLLWWDHTRASAAAAAATTTASSEPSGGSPASHSVPNRRRSWVCQRWVHASTLQRHGGRGGNAPHRRPGGWGCVA